MRTTPGSTTSRMTVLDIFSILWITCPFDICLKYFWSNTKYKNRYNCQLCRYYLVVIKDAIGVK